MNGRSAAVRLAEAAGRVRRLEAEYEAAQVAARAVMGDDPAVVSGVRRRPSGRAQCRRVAVYDREAALAAELVTARAAVAWRERQVRAGADAAAVDLSELAPGCLVRTKRGWHEVATVNKVSVSVVTGESWATLIRFAKILEIAPSPSRVRSVSAHPAGKAEQ